MNIRAACILTVWVYASWMVENCFGVKCYICKYSTRPGVEHSDPDCLDNLESSTIIKYDCAKRGAKYCVKGYEDGESNGKPYSSILRSCVPTRTDKPCLSEDKTTPNPVITRLMKTTNGSADMFKQGMYGRVSICLCTTDFCNDEPGYSTTKGDLGTTGGGVSVKGSGRKSVAVV